MPKGLWVRPNLPNIFCTQTFCLPKKKFAQFFFFFKFFFSANFFFFSQIFFTKIFFHNFFFAQIIIYFIKPNFFVFLLSRKYVKKTRF